MILPLGYLSCSFSWRPSSSSHVHRHGPQSSHHPSSLLPNPAPGLNTPLITTITSNINASTHPVEDDTSTRTSASPNLVRLFGQFSSDLFSPNVLRRKGTSGFLGKAIMIPGVPIDPTFPTTVVLDSLFLSVPLVSCSSRCCHSIPRRSQICSENNKESIEADGWVCVNDCMRNFHYKKRGQRRGVGFNLWR